MEPEEPGDLQTEVTDASSMLSSTAVEGDDLGLSGYVQDNFDFLDQMDCSVLDHMDLYSSYQVCSGSPCELKTERVQQASLSCQGRWFDV